MRTIVLAALLLLAGCVRTTVPLHPIPNQPDTYRFGIELILMHVNDFATAADHEAEKHMKAMGYTSFEILHSTCAGGTCTYTVRFGR